LHSDVLLLNVKFIFLHSNLVWIAWVDNPGKRIIKIKNSMNGFNQVKVKIKLAIRKQFGHLRKLHILAALEAQTAMLAKFLACPEYRVR
jgi:hypothetical protein